MPSHPNAKLTPRGRETLVSRIESGVGVADAARQTACKWLRRSRRGEGLADRSSRPRRLARLTPPDA
ncbi:leucine zipper domain-containing protein, partial [Adlercreutzia caecimuris]|uniref:leucine zipper domain-containing protein n=1 Tax=Adlercreutzia caecimuris TaxID=671266 RepID=UPI0020CFC5B0